VFIEASLVAPELICPLNLSVVSLYASEFPFNFGSRRFNIKQVIMIDVMLIQSDSEKTSKE
jgi:hypothetical protein